MQFGRHKYACVIVVAFVLGASSPTQARYPTVLGAGQETGSGKPSAAVPAQWQTFELLLDFQNLPRTYSCDELWYKFRDVLRKLGARASTTITPYDCGYLGGGEARSPHVEIKFQVPRLLHGADIRFAEMSVHEKSVMLAPDSPHTLGAHDCEFARQVQSLLLPAIPVRVDKADFHCSEAPPSYKIVVRAQFVLPKSSTPVPASSHS